MSNNMMDTCAKNDTVMVSCRRCKTEFEFFRPPSHTQAFYLCSECVGALPKCPMFRSHCLMDECTAYSTFEDQNAMSVTHGQMLGFCQILNTHLPTLKEV
jgi:hypothetical protein